MATLAELERALVAADAAGNTEDARALAQAIAAQRQPKAQQTPERAPRATDTMSGLDRFRAGIGKSLVDTATGLVQATVDQGSRVAGLGDVIINSGIGNEGFRRGVQRANDLWRAPQRYLQEKAEERRKLDEDLVATPGGLLGNVAGTLAQVVGPGLAARGSGAAATLLPTTVRGSAVQGGLLGYVQPATSEADRAANAGIGAGGGLLGAAIPAAAGRAVQAVKQVGAPFTQRGTEEAAARVIRGFAEDPARLVRNPSSVPGVQRTLAEETLDPGIAQLQRAVSAREGAAFDSLRRGNNAARVGAIRQFAGDEADIAAAEAARDAAAVPLLQRAETVTGVDTQPVRDYVQQAIDANATRPTVRNAVRDVQAALNEAGDDVSSLYNLRKYIDDLLQGRVGGEQGYARAASRELQGVKGALDQQLESASPEFGQYLDLYRSGSAPINRMQAGQELLRRSSGGIADPTTGLEVLTPAAFGRSARNLDAIAASGTGFGKASAANVFQPSDLATIRGVNDDLARQAFADTAGRGSGSDTFQKLATNGDILGAVQELGVNIPGSGVIRMLGSAGRDRVNRQLVEILTDPARAQDVLRRTSASDRKVIQGVLTAMGGESGTALAVGSSN
ncbi:hypothetical protein QEG46_002570 [Stenotrophomonas maltophilia]|nr:hypothetical protein [Stenotrophomonas maltophilia]